MFGTKRFDGFQFKNDTVVHNDIGKIVTHFAPFKIDLNVSLRFTAESPSYQFLI